MSDRDVTEITAKHTYGTWRFQRGWKPLHVTRAEGCYFWDKAGKRYLDLSAQLMCSNLGHQNAAVVEAICKQARDLAFISPGFACDVRADLALKLLDVMPPGLDKFFFTTSGTEANECAIKMARACTGKYKIIARYAAYHGSTAASISATGDYRRWFAEPTGVVDGVIRAPDAYCYRCPLGRTYPDCAVACADYVEYMLENEANVAAIILEPVVGTNGVLVPPKEYLPRVAAIAKQRGILLIADEVMSGWGRTGEWFAVNNWGVVPDILCTAKGITSAAAPLGVVATSRAISDFFDDNMFAHGHTYEAHPLTLAPALAAIDEYRRLDLLAAARRQGEKLGAKLHALTARHPSIGEVRGIGLFWALDLVKNRQSRAPFNTPYDKATKKPMVVDAVCAELMKLGVFCVGWMSHLVLAPPLIIDDAGIDEAVAALDKALSVADAQVS